MCRRWSRPRDHVGMLRPTDRALPPTPTDSGNRRRQPFHSLVCMYVCSHPEYIHTCKPAHKQLRPGRAQGQALEAAAPAFVYLQRPKPELSLQEKGQALAKTFVCVHYKLYIHIVLAVSHCHTATDLVQTPLKTVGSVRGLCICGEGQSAQTGSFTIYIHQPLYILAFTVS